LQNAIAIVMAKSKEHRRTLYFSSHDAPRHLPPNNDTNMVKKNSK